MVIEIRVRKNINGTANKVQIINSGKMFSSPKFSMVAEIALFVDLNLRIWSRHLKVRESLQAQLDNYT